MSANSVGSVAAAAEVLRSWSPYVSGFMARRSMVTASLFPEKSAQLSFGYEYCARVLPALTDDIASRWTPEDFGTALREAGTGQGLRLASALWTGSLGMLSRVLREQGEVSGAPLVVDYWSRALAAHLGESGYAWPEGSTLRPTYRVWPEERRRSLGAALNPEHVEQAARLGGVLANYCWLLECESRQSVFNHGPYDRGDGKVLLVKEFLDLRGDAYPWMPQAAKALPHGTLTVAVELTGWSAQFDVLGTSHAQVDLTQMGITAAAVLLDGEPVEDVSSWIKGFLADLQAAHRALYRTVARWERRDRFVAGPSTHARLWRALLSASGSPAEAVTALVNEPLEDHVHSAFEQWNSEPGLDVLWTWVGSHDQGPVFGPLIRALGATSGD